MTTARKTHKPTHHTNYQWLVTGSHGAYAYQIRHYTMIDVEAAEERTITAPMMEGIDLYTHCTRNATPNTWRTQ